MTLLGHRPLREVALILVLAAVMASPLSLGLLPGGAMHAAPVGLRLAGSLPDASAVSHPAAPQFAATPSAGSGPGTFFNNTQIPLPTSPTCFHGYGVSAGACANITNEPSINFTSTGVLAMAYTAMTNATACPNVTASVASEVGFVRSTDMGATWSTPVYLGNTQCSTGPAFSSSWEPSLTSLANGTLVLVYIEYNMSQNSVTPYSYYAAYIPYAWEQSTPSSRLVLTESYDGGINWTTPTVLNSSMFNASGNLLGWAPERPWVSAVGQTVYVTWENFTQSALYPQSYYPNFAGAASIGSHLLVSKDGGVTWGTPVDFPVKVGTIYPFHEWVDMNPTVLAASNGSLYVAFTTNVSYALPCGMICLQNPVESGDVVVGESQDNGTTFTWADVATTVALSALWGPFFDPSPQLAANPALGQVYVTYSAAIPGTYCFPGTPVFCGLEAAGTGVYFANSSNGGARWSAVHLVDPALVDAAGGPNDATYNPSLVVDNHGVVHVEMSYSQIESCPGYCVLQKQLYYNSTDNGTTFSGGFAISGNYTYAPYEWDGEYDTMASAGGHLWIAYVQDLCPAWTTQTCYMYSSTSGRAQVTVAEPFYGAGATLTFTESGLPSGTPWSVNVLGNERSANAPASLSVSGAPLGQWLNWTIPWDNQSYGVAYTGSIPAGTSYILGGNTTIPVTFTQLVRVQVETLPTFNPCYIGNCLNWNLPTLGVTWVPLGTVSTVAVSNLTVSCGPPYGCQYVNASFLGWVGAGNGSVTSNSTSITFTANGPVNETANFAPNAVCNGYITFTCTGGATFDVTFDESGLPTGTAWSVSADGLTATSTTNSLVLSVPNGTVPWTAWSVPDGGSNIWLPSSTSASIVQVPYTTTVDITYTKVSTASQSFPVQFNAAGLPPGTNWAANLSGSLYPFSNSNGSTTVPASTYNLSFAPIYLENGTGYSAQNVFVQPFVMNATPVNLTGGGRLVVAGPVAVTASFQATVEVAVSAGPGGTVSPSVWVPPGNGVTLHATASAGYVFAGWAGYGRGATTAGQSSSLSPTIFPLGPVTEVASFTKLPAQRFVATVEATGLPAGQGFTLSLGERNATSGTSSLAVANLLPGFYALSVPTVFANGTDSARYEFGSATVSGGTLYPNGTIQLTGDLTLNLTFDASYLVTVSTVGNGTLSVSAGQYWVNSGSAFEVTATAPSGARFIGWTGTGNGSYSGPLNALALSVLGAIEEVASFGPAPPPPTFTLTVSQSGLPLGLGWAVVLGSVGGSGTGTKLAVGGLSGMYALNLPPVAGTVDGTRYVGNLTANYSVMVSANRSIPVSYSEQFRLTVSTTEGGSATPTGVAWLAAGAMVDLTATPASGHTFVSWNGTGASAYSGTATTTSFAIGSPVAEVANFAPVATHTTTTSSSGSGSSPWIAIGAFVGLLIVGTVVGVLVARNRRTGRAPPSAPAEESESAAPEPAPASDTYSGEVPTMPSENDGSPPS